jgi:hypothetical protein
VPVYEYEIRAGRSGEILGVITLPLPVSERDAVEISRRSVPASIGIVGSVPNPAAPDRQVLGAYERLERRIGNNAEFHRRIGHSPAVVKQAWSQPA